MDKIARIKLYKDNEVIYKKICFDFLEEKKRIEEKYSLEIVREEDYEANIKQLNKEPYKIIYKFTYYKNGYRMEIMIRDISIDAKFIITCNN